MLDRHEQQLGGGIGRCAIEDGNGVSLAVDDDAFFPEARQPRAGGDKGNASRVHVVQERRIGGPHGPGADDVDVFDHFLPLLSCGR